MEGTRQGGEYAFVLNGVSYAEMNQDIKAELVLGEQTLATLESYSVAQNFKNLLARSADELGLSEKVDAALKSVLSEMLTSGISKQAMKEYSDVLRSR